MSNTTTVKQKNSLDLINKLARKLNTATEYHILLNKLQMMNEIGQYSKNLHKSKFDEYINTGKMLCSDNFKENVKDEDYIKIYCAWPEHTDRFVYILNIVTYPRIGGLPEELGRIPDTITYITEEYYDEIYDNICDRLNEIEEKYREIVNSVKEGES